MATKINKKPTSNESTEIDLKNIDPNTLKLAQQLAREMQASSSKGKKSDKLICSAAVLIPTKDQVNKEIEEKNDVYLVLEKENGKEKKLYYKKCCKNIFESNDFCWTHLKTSEKGQNSVIKFMDIVKRFENSKNNENSPVKKMEKTDLLKVNAGSKKVVNNSSDPIISINLIKSVRDEFKKYSKYLDDSYHDDQTDDHDDQTDDQAKDDSDRDDQANDQANDEKNDSDVDNDDDAKSSHSDSDTDSDVDCKSIKDKNGIEYNLLEAENKLYSDDGTFLGNFYEVDDKNAAISYEGANYICAIELKYKDIIYMKCKTSNNLYKDKKIAGTVQKNGSVKLK